MTVCIVFVAVGPDHPLAISRNAPRRYAVFGDYIPLVILGRFDYVFFYGQTLRIERFYVVIGIQEVLVGEDKNGGLIPGGEVEGSLRQVEGLFK